MAEKCNFIKRTCKKCGWKCEEKEKPEVCPNCGADMHCGNWAVWSSTKCKEHGGPVPNKGWYGPGMAIVNGGGSKFPIARLASKYIEMENDGRILSNRQSLEIIRTRVQQLAERIDLNQDPMRLDKIQKLWVEYRAQQIVGDELEARKTAKLIDAEFEAAYHDYMAWTQMFEALDLDKKMVESEVKIAKEMKAILTAADAYELAAKLLAAIIEAAGALILDDNTRSKFLKRVQYEFGRIVGDSAGREDDAGSQRSSGEIIDSVSSVVD